MKELVRKVAVTTNRIVDKCEATGEFTFILPALLLRG